MSSVEIVCRAKAHETKVAKVATFFPREPESAAMQAAATAVDPDWPATSYYDVVEGEADRWSVDDVASSTGRQIPGDFAVTVRRGVDPDPRRRPDERWSLECRLCGLKVSVREQTLAPILSKARDSGMSEIPLELLASMLHR